MVLDIASAAARFGLAFMWIYSGYTKLGAHLDVTKSIEAYEIFTPYWSDLLARVIGPLEIAGGLLLLLGIKLRWAGGVSIAVLAAFIVGLYSAYSRGLTIDCGCFNPGGSGDAQPGELLRAIVRDFGLIAVTAFMMWRPFRKYALYP
nr:MauE/DoxX family redox-associated membrane protein [Corynebacterium stercoris]